jgi:hypothetical protein
MHQTSKQIHKRRIPEQGSCTEKRSSMKTNLSEINWPFSETFSCLAVLVIIVELGISHNEKLTLLVQLENRTVL